jgi:hypothetical protein
LCTGIPPGWDEFGFGVLVLLAKLKWPAAALARWPFFQYSSSS